MEPESSSFWSEIKKYEDILAKDPQSYCFAPLSELYRKMGLFDDALNVAKRGCEIHPDYVGGFMALGRAYYEKGMKAESRAALESVVRGTPDNLLAQKFLSQLYIEEGERAAAEIALRTILSLNPGDSESQVLLESLKKASAAGGAQLSENSTGVLSTVTADSDSVQEFPDEEVLLEELEVVDDFANETTSAEEGSLSVDFISYPVQTATDSAAEAFDEFFLNEDTKPAKKMVALATAGGDDDEESALPAMAEETLQFAEESAFPEGKDPLTTVTLAELYISQGFLKRALTIYRELLTVDPDNEELRQRLMDLKLTIDKDDASARVHALEDESAAPESTGVAMGISLGMDEEDAARAGAGTGDEVLTTLETWLENISRRRQ